MENTPAPEIPPLPSIILIAPQMGENIGAAARSMKNFGLTDLRIVNPRDGWPNPKAVDMSKGAKDIIKDAKIYNSLEEAASDINFLYATTARPRDMVKEEVDAKECADEITSHSKSGSKCAIMFGPERTGLDNTDISYANKIVIVPVSKIYSSLNLAQAVTILCYEFFQNINKHTSQISAPKADSLASKKDLTALFSHLEQELGHANFFQVDEKKPKMMNNIRNMFVRADLTEQEVRTLRGVIKAIGSK